MHSKNTSYRPDIDGLRAIAIVLVLLFHFGLGVPGGFVGVDVFFVISGFLITEVIKNSIERKRFSFFDFYARRLLRLHPALIVTVALCLGAGYLLMDPASYSTLASASSYAIFSASNFYFWMHQGYFDADALTQPLLHTWSLAAEWQFYLVWPFVVWGALKVSSRFLAGLLAVMTVVSLVSSQWMLSYDSSAAYFMMPFRVFELSIGALLVFVHNHRASKTVESCVLTLGVALIVVAAFVLDPAAPFPGLRALLPCLGAAACIYAGKSKTVGAALRLKPVVYIGLISYSVYLIHWPLMVFYKYYIFRDLMLAERFGLLAVSLLLGSALYHTVERVFMGKSLSLKVVGLTSVTATALALLAISMTVISEQGFKSRVPGEYLAFADDPVAFHTKNYGGHGYSLDTNIGNAEGRKIAVFGGDSFALQYASGLDKILKTKNQYVSGTFRHGCILSGDYTRMINNAPRPECQDAYRNILSQLEGNNLPFIYALSWNGYFNAIADADGSQVKVSTIDEYYTLIAKILNKIREDIGDRNFVIVGNQPFPENLKSPASCLLRPQYVFQECENRLKYAESKAASNKMNEVLKSFAESHKNTYYLDASSAFCKDGMCTMVDGGKILYSDSFHLSIDGSEIASKYIDDGIESIIKPI